MTNRTVSAALQTAIEKEAQEHVRFFAFEGETEKERAEAYARRVSKSRADWLANGFVSDDVRKHLETFTVTGGEGSLTVCAETGDILSRDPGAYPAFTRIDVAEWRAFYPGETLAGQSVDILDTAGYEGASYSPAESDFRLELAFAHSGGEFIPAERFRSVEVCGWIESDGAIEGIPGRPASEAHGFGVYGREAEGDPLAVHLFDMASHDSALALAIEYASRDALPVHNLVTEEA